MQVAKWGNSLAVRLPADVVKALDLHAGDDIEIVISDDRRFEVRANPRRTQAIDKLRALRVPLPDGFIFDRAEAHER